jgi:hypothetical protein
VGGVAEAEQKKEKNYGQIGLKIDSGRITAEYLRQGMSLLGGGSMRSGEVTADKNGSIYTVQSAGATDGFGPKLYDIVMEAATANGSMLTSDRHSVSDDAYRVWNYYFKNRGDVKKTPLSPENWYHGQKWFDQSKFPSEDPKTWAPKSDDAWTLLTGYSKAPSLINDPKLVQRLAKGGSVEDTVPALLTPGEFVVNKQAAQKIGYSKLHQLNHADKIAGFNKGGVVGGVQTFAAGGAVSFSGIAESIFGWLKTNSKAGSPPVLPSRPDYISRSTVQAADKSVSAVKELV